MIDDFYSKETYGLSKHEKDALITKELMDLTEFHNERCHLYSNILKGLVSMKSGSKTVRFGSSSQSVN